MDLITYLILPQFLVGIPASRNFGISPYLSAVSLGQAGGTGRAGKNQIFPANPMQWVAGWSVSCVFGSCPAIAG
ncbi:MAG: hypothetical protein IIA61_10595 [Candidatus Marinimicrobia bacterium]|nr:hypothetical protein [Candidatus Neomarinimicrobiota bacterium]